MALARFYGATGDEARAKEMYQKAMALESDNSVLATSAARYLFNIKQFDEALGGVDKVLEGRSNFIPALMLKGEILAGKRQWNDAIAIFDQIIAQGLAIGPGALP